MKRQLLFGRGRWLLPALACLALLALLMLPVRDLRAGANPAQPVAEGALVAAQASHPNGGGSFSEAALRMLYRHETSQRADA